MGKQYDKQFKEEALKYRENHMELSTAAVCRNLGIALPTYYSWKSKASENGGKVCHRGSGNYESDEVKEIARLKHELAIKEDALKILNKAMGILGEELK